MLKAKRWYDVLPGDMVFHGSVFRHVYGNPYGNKYVYEEDSKVSFHSNDIVLTFTEEKERE